MCEKCKHLCITQRIKCPRDLENALRVIKDNLADSTIIESKYWPKDKVRIQWTPFLEVEEEGPWDDIIDYYFECTQCKQIFSLDVETYHGSGGRWEPLTDLNRV